MRGRFRDSYEKPEPFSPGKVTKVEFTEPDVNHTFRCGHRIMIQIQSTWFPLVDINPQKFVDIYTAKPEDFQKATQRVHHSVQAPSHVEVVMLNR
jgi:predicted acyl esterase